VRTAAERLAVLDEMLTEAAGRGLLLRTPDDEPLDSTRECEKPSAQP
jgi:hypothetical protein